MVPMAKKNVTLLFMVFVSLIYVAEGSREHDDDKEKCPKVKEIRNFDIAPFLGSWFIVQYYASSEEVLAYRCMEAQLSLSPKNAEITMNFTYSFTDDPINEQIVGNITWNVPSQAFPAHWIHTEDPYEEVYNTYVLDTNYKSWALLMHCAEKNKSVRYLSSLIMSRERTLGPNVISYLREKLPRHVIDLEFMFPMDQDDCGDKESNGSMIPPVVAAKRVYTARKHPLKNKNQKRY